MQITFNASTYFLLMSVVLAFGLTTVHVSCQISINLQ